MIKVFARNPLDVPHLLASANKKAVWIGNLGAAPDLQIKVMFEQGANLLLRVSCAGWRSSPQQGL